MCEERRHVFGLPCHGVDTNVSFVRFVFQHTTHKDGAALCSTETIPIRYVYVFMNTKDISRPRDGSWTSEVHRRLRLVVVATKYMKLTYENVFLKSLIQ